ncbi:hypothetical protein Kfla_3711 [Kribbella flavida DSM 17836]|uniref:Uncharacterized protein n=1 Tax=Kribbella flavida (strain DSM 17836 / JCM 10339 / NBRC 14399) TaxID=479435 RepID=D2PNU8_KRIFD|nr:hypothetical protein [Kribbella flavida]ADB32766.1 hypothetical protein Kfla_3711 [Kribbella flavida DSM 17836]
MRYLWAVPAAVIGWFVAGFAASYLAGLPAGATTFVPGTAARLDLLVLGGFAGGVAAGFLLGRLRIAGPVVLVVAAGTWWLSGNSPAERDLLITLLVASAVGAFFGALGTRSSVVAAVALTLPFAWYAVRPAAELAEWRWLWQLNGLLIAVGLATILYLCCWRRGWRSAYYWPLVSAAFLVSFAVVDAVRAVASAAGRPADEVADVGTEGFFQAFEPLLRDYWPWMVLAVLLAIPMTALKLRALPPAPPPPDPYADRPNDAVLSSDLDWIDQLDPEPRSLPRRQPVG